MPRGIMKWDIGRGDSNTTEMKCTRVIKTIRHGFEAGKRMNKLQKVRPKKKKKKSGTNRVIWCVNMK